MKHAAAMTGISPATLRMWERRYEVVVPGRSPSGYRVYDDAAVRRLSAMRALVEAGWSPRLAAERVRSGTTGGSPERAPGARRTAWTAQLPTLDAADAEALVRVAEQFDGDAARGDPRPRLRVRHLRGGGRRLADAGAARAGQRVAPGRGLGGGRALRQRRRAPAPRRRPRRTADARGRTPGRRRARPGLTPRAGRARVRGDAEAGRARRRLRRQRSAPRELGRRSRRRAPRRRRPRRADHRTTSPPCATPWPPCTPPIPTCRSSSVGGTRTRSGVACAQPLGHVLGAGRPRPRRTGSVEQLAEPALLLLAVGLLLVALLVCPAGSRWSWLPAAAEVAPRPPGRAGSASARGSCRAHRGRATPRDRWGSSRSRCRCARSSRARSRRSGTAWVLLGRVRVGLETVAA